MVPVIRDMALIANHAWGKVCIAGDTAFKSYYCWISLPCEEYKDITSGEPCVIVKIYETAEEKLGERL